MSFYHSCVILLEGCVKFDSGLFHITGAKQPCAKYCGGDQSGRINSSHSIIEELARFARSDWMGLSGGDQSGRINSSHSMIYEFACFAPSDWMGLSGGDQSERINSSHSIIDNFSTSQNNFSSCKNNFSSCQNKKNVVWKKKLNFFLERNKIWRNLFLKQKRIFFLSFFWKQMLKKNEKKLKKKN